MNNTAKSISVLAFALIAGMVSADNSAPVVAGESEAKPDVIKIPFTEDNIPMYLDADLLEGGITVIGGDVNEVRIEALSRVKAAQKKGAERGGLKLIRGKTSSGVYAEVDGNRIEVGVESWKAAVDLKIFVPRQMSLELNAVNHGSILVQGVNGDLEIECLNGNVVLEDCGGSVIANALNQGIKAVLTSVDPDKSMSFSSLNGTIDVTLPESVSADLKLETFSGDILSDFDIEIMPVASDPVVEKEGDRNGRYRIGFDSAFHGRINGGGELYRFETHNGDIIIRRGQK